VNFVDVRALHGACAFDPSEGARVQHQQPQLQQQRAAFASNEAALAWLHWVSTAHLAAGNVQQPQQWTSCGMAVGAQPAAAEGQAGAQGQL